MTPEQENWRHVVGYEGLYKVSDLGRVRSVDRTDLRGRVLLGRLLRPQVLDDAGRIGVCLSREGTKRTVRISVLVLESFVEPRPDGLVCCHNDGDLNNNSLGNLRWDTSSANALDAVRHGTHTKTRRMHCPRGHPLIAPNLSGTHARKGQRTCLACHRALCSRRKAELRGKRFDMQREADERFAKIMQSRTTT